jgi:hypothetical protein
MSEEDYSEYKEDTFNREVDCARKWMIRIVIIIFSD